MNAFLGKKSNVQNEIWKSHMCNLVISNKEIMFSVSFVCLSVSNNVLKIMNRLQWNFVEGFGVLKNKWLNFGDDLDHHADC